MKPIKDTSEPPDRDRRQGVVATSVEFRSGLEVLRGRSEMPKLTTGNADLDSLLGGGIEPGHFYLFYGDDKSGVTSSSIRFSSTVFYQRRNSGLTVRLFTQTAGTIERKRLS